MKGHKYQISVEKDFFDNWLKEFNAWKAKQDRTSDGVFLSNLIDELLTTANVSKLVSTKYVDFEQELYERYIGHIKNQIYKILPLAEEQGEWRKHLETLLVELSGSDKVFLHTTNFISLISKLETLKHFPQFDSSLSLAEIKSKKEFKTFRKTIFECMNIAEMLGDD